MRPLSGPLPPRTGPAVRHDRPREQARIALTTAIELYRAMDMTFWLPQTEAALAQVACSEERRTDHGCEPSQPQRAGDYSKSAPRALGFPTGDEVEFIEVEGGLRVQKRRQGSPFSRYRGYLSHLKGQDPDALLEAMRGQ